MTDNAQKRFNNSTIELFLVMMVVFWQVDNKIRQVDKYMTSRLKILTSQLLNYMYLTNGGIKRNDDI